MSPPQPSPLVRWLARFTNAFPLWVVLGGAWALIDPPAFRWVSPTVITWGLAVIMLGMGLTLSVSDFRAVLHMPAAIGAGFAAQYLIMPFLGWSIAYATELPTPLAVGLILVSCCPGGTASNVVTYLARGNVALSVLMTMCSTFAAIAATPLLTAWLAGTLVEVPAWGLFLSTIKVVLVPLVAGISLNHFCPRFVRFIVPASPLVSVIAIAIICAGIIGENAPHVLQSGGRLLLAVFILHAFGFWLGYAVARILGYDRTTCRTISIEVGMQNSGLGTLLAKANFPNAPLTALPCAISATFHSVIGSLLAGIWRLRPPRA